MSSMNESLPKSITFMLQTHKLKFHHCEYATHELQQALNHGRRTVQTNILAVLDRYCPADFKTPLY